MYASWWLILVFASGQSIIYGFRNDMYGTRQSLRIIDNLGELWSLTFSKENVNYMYEPFRYVKPTTHKYKTSKVPSCQWHCKGTMRSDIVKGQWGRTGWWVTSITLIGWRVPFGLCNLLFLRHHYNVNEQIFFNPMRDQNIQRKKCENVLCYLKMQS